MELRARAKQRTERLPPSPPKQNGAYDQSIYIRCNALLYNTIQNMIRASHAAMDFTYLSPTDFIRSALRASQEDMELTELEEAGDKIATTLRVDRSLKAFYQSWPRSLRTRLLERAIRTFLKQQ